MRVSYTALVDRLADFNLRDIFHQIRRAVNNAENRLIILENLIASAGIGSLVVGCRLWKAGDQTITTGTQPALNFDTDFWDTDEMHNVTTNNTRITFRRTGKYIVGASAAFASNAVGSRELALKKNGTLYLDIDDKVGAGGGIRTSLRVETCDHFEANDYVEVEAFQNSGGNLNITAGGNWSPVFWAHKVS